MEGKVIKGFELKRLLGKGGMAEVWYAENEIRKPAAVKMLNAELSHNAQVVERFRREAEIMVELNHPNIRQVYGYGAIDGHPCIIMEYLEGNDLKSMLREGQRFKESDLERWWNQMVSALNYTHGRGIVHRDIKPSNLFVDGYGNIKLLDFGIAKVRESISVTQTGQKLGTLMYMSPEQVKDSKHIDYRTDLYSLAVTFVHLLTGRNPYDSDTSSDFEISEQIVYKPLDMEGVPETWRSFLLPYLEKESERRPALLPFGAAAVGVGSKDGTIVEDADLVAKPDALHKSSQGDSGKKDLNEKAVVKEGKRNSKLWLAIVGVAVVAVVVLVVLLRPKKPKIDPDTEAYAACKTIEDYRAYLQSRDSTALHYAEAKALIEQYELDSVNRLGQTEAERQEEEMFEKCTTIKDCNAYLKAYPDGKYVLQVMAKKTEIENAKKNDEKTASQKGENTKKSQAQQDFENALALLQKGDMDGIGMLRKVADEGFAPAQSLLASMYEKGLMVDKNYYEAFEWYQKAAEQGDSGAQNQMGMMYLDGKGVDKDYAKAMQWFKKAANQDLPVAMYNMGFLYDNGLGVTEDDTEAVKWYQKAAGKGEPHAQFSLGIMYDNGQGVKQDKTEAAKWYQKAADQGYANAQLNLGVLYRKGEGVAQNDAEAMKWYRKAADQGNAIAQLNLGVMYKKGIGVDIDITEAKKWLEKSAAQGDQDAIEQLKDLNASSNSTPNPTSQQTKTSNDETAQQNYDKGKAFYDAKNYSEALKSFKKAADEGNARAQFYLGVMYDNGEGVTQDKAEAAKWYRKAADQGHVDAQFNLALSYAKGEGVSKSYSEAAKWYRKAADQGDSSAQFNLGNMYRKGEGVTQDKAEAVKWYRKAADQGHAKAQYNLGLMYDDGEGVTQDRAEAAKWYRKAADQGHVSAQYNLGLMYDYGEGVTRDRAEAAKWYRKAADQGHAQAQYNLGLMYELGIGVEKDLNEARKWYQKAANQGNQKAIDNLKELDSSSN